MPARWFQPPALVAFCDILVAQLDCRAAASCVPLMLTQPGSGLRFSCVPPISKTAISMGQYVVSPAVQQRLAAKVQGMAAG